MMADQTNLLEQTVADHSRAIVQINEILLAVARHLDSVGQRLDSMTVRIESVNQQQEANAHQIAANAQAIAALQAIMYDRYGGNGHRDD